jgi:membrane protein
MRLMARRVRANKLWQRATEIELMHRALGFAALSFMTLVPLLIVVAAVAPLEKSGFGQWVVIALGLSGDSARTVEKLFNSPRQVLSATTAFSLAILAVFGLMFGQTVQVGYERIWRLCAAKWHSHWRHAIWLAGLVGYLFFQAQLQALLEGFPFADAEALLVTVLLSVVFFWWTQRLLLCGRVPWLELLPGAVLTVLGLVGLRVFSAYIFAPLIVANAVTYGPVGTVLMVQSWLVGVGFVVYGGAMVGELLHEWNQRRDDEASGGGGAGRAGRVRGTGGTTRTADGSSGGPDSGATRLERTMLRS